MLVQVNGVRHDRIRIFPNTVDIARFRPGPKLVGLAEKLGIPGKVPVLLTVARLDISERYKGIEQVWEAMQSRKDGLLAEAVHLVAGGGDDLDRLRDEASRRGLGQRVFLTGPVARQELSQLYRLADVFVMPSLKEGFGIVFLEAMATGIPVVAAAAGGAPDALRDGELGWLADPASAESLATCLEAALSHDPADLRCHSGFLRSSVEKHFGPEAFRARLDEVLKGA
jgi:glycosyltransferase involved in cell wall biosynthesis